MIDTPEKTIFIQPNRQSKPFSVVLMNKSRPPQVDGFLFIFRIYLPSNQPTLMRHLITVLFICLSIGGFAQTDAKTEKIKKLLATMEVEKMAEQGFNSIMAIYKQQVQDSTARLLFEEVSKEMHSSVSEIVALIIPIYTKYFTEADIDGLIAFYNTPVGKKFIQNQANITAESTLAGQQWGQMLSEKIVNKLKEKGYPGNQ